MVNITATVYIDLEVDEAILKEYDNNARKFLSDDIQVDTIDGMYLSYEIEDVDCLIWDD